MIGVFQGSRVVVTSSRILGVTVGTAENLVLFLSIFPTTLLQSSPLHLHTVTGSKATAPRDELPGAISCLEACTQWRNNCSPSKEQARQLERNLTLIYPASWGKHKSKTWGKTLKSPHKSPGHHSFQFHPGRTLAHLQPESKTGAVDHAECRASLREWRANWQGSS